MRVAVVITVIVLVLAGLATADWYVRNLELEQLVAATRGPSEEIDRWRTTRHEILSELPSAHFVTPEMRERAERQLGRAAADAAEALEGSTAELEAVSVRVPWHQGIRRARDRYVDYTDAWVARLEQLARDPAAVEEPAPQLTEARSASERAFRDAIPPVALDGIDTSIERLFAG